MAATILCATNGYTCVSRGLRVILYWCVGLGQRELTLTLSNQGGGDEEGGGGEGGSSYLACWMCVGCWMDVGCWMGVGLIFFRKEKKRKRYNL